MKAEHRKELETNVLADRMGRLLDTVKQKPQRGTVGWVVLGVVVAVVVFLSVRWYRMAQVERSDAWFDYYLVQITGDIRTLRDSQNVPGKAVRFLLASNHLWDAVTKMGADPAGTKEKLREAKNLYEDLRKECEDDPVLLAEAIYGQALAEETLAIEDRKYLDSAIDIYKELVVEKHAKTVYGKLAEKRLEILNDPDKRREVSDIYHQLQRDMLPFGRKKT